jgi:hypothetical protein
LALAQDQEPVYGIIVALVFWLPYAVVGVVALLIAKRLAARRLVEGQG